MSWGSPFLFLMNVSQKQPERFFFNNGNLLMLNLNVYRHTKMVKLNVLVQCTQIQVKSPSSQKS